MEGKLDLLIQGCKSNDIKAQKDIYNLFAAKMYGACLRLTKNEENAKDILHDGFIKVFRKIDQYDYKGSFEGWVRRIIINTAIEKLRQNKIIYDIEEVHVAIKTHSYENISEEINYNDLLNLIKELTPAYQMVFNLYVLEGYSHKEIGKMLNISEGTSKSNLARARLILQEKVRKLYRTAQKVTEIKKHE